MTSTTAATRSQTTATGPARPRMAAVLLAAGALALAGCSGGQSAPGGAPQAAPSASSTAASGTPGAEVHNAADVTFLTDMIPHHEQAVQLSVLVPQRSQNQAVIKLASEISAEQGPEIETMKTWLAQWGAPVPAAPAGGHHGSMATAGMPGMVDDTMMTRLTGLSGPPFYTLWLQSMIGHHEGAVDMADTELRDGSSPQAKQLAHSIVDSQSAQITQMKQMLGN